MTYKIAMGTLAVLAFAGSVHAADIKDCPEKTLLSLKSSTTLAFRGLTVTASSTQLPATARHGQGKHPELKMII
ncbi:hypothetical protein [Pseudomonas sp.]|uniref:hypothetical protein n=1 Tax=Pseudomonas sp. TaxID=306 RepID=UPI0028B01CBC|nr:hypothetical protein [Pseudomonas sp.]